MSCSSSISHASALFGTKRRLVRRKISIRENYKKAVICIKPSKIIPGEVGIFSLRNIPKNTIIALNSDFKEDTFISWKEFKMLDNITKKRLISFCAKTDKGIFAPININNISIPWHINHSCNPNVFCSDNGDYITIKNIKVGEELTLDITTIVKDGKFKFNCNCGSNHCKKIVKM
jgi:SET domain-containing protein